MSKDNLLIILKSFIVCLIIGGALFFNSFVITSTIVNKNGYEQTSSFSSNPNIQREDTYLIYANTDPIIQKVELYIAQHGDSMSEEERLRVEKIRSDRINELMSRKYMEILKQVDKGRTKNL